jgi:plasmid stabilization system protein ParE
VRLRFTPRALSDLIAIADYLREQSPAAAKRVRAAIYESLETLLTFPRIGRAQTTPGIRKIVTRQFSYLVYYTINEENREVVILGVKHPARDRDHADQ